MLFRSRLQDDGLLYHQLYQMTREVEEQVFGSRDIGTGGVHFDPDPDPVDHHLGDDSQPLDDDMHPDGYISPMDDSEVLHPRELT